MLARNVGRLGASGVPAGVVAELEAGRRANGVRNALLTRELTRLLIRFGEAGLPVIPQKGVALAETLYGDVTARVSWDIDILVPRSMVKQAFDLLVEAGYQPDESSPDARGMELFLRSNIESRFVRETPSFSVVTELHWDIAWRWWPNGASDLLWADARRKTFWGVEAYALSPEWELIYLAVHAARHRWQLLKWLVDIHEFCCRVPVDWEKVRENAARSDLERVLRLSLGACGALLGTPVPDGLRLDSLPPWLVPLPVRLPLPDEWRDAFFATRLKGRLSAKLRYLARVLVVPSSADRRLLPLPSPLRGFYCLVRPLRLGSEGACWLARRGSRRLTALLQR
jgi:hypothetical protein